jgi:hypothetical protein
MDLVQPFKDELKLINLEKHKPHQHVTKIMRDHYPRQDHLLVGTAWAMAKCIEEHQHVTEKVVRDLKAAFAGENPF